MIFLIRINYYLNWKSCWQVRRTHQCMRGTHILVVACTALSGGKKYPSIMLLKVSMCPLLLVWCLPAVMGRFITGGVFSFFSIFYLKNYKLVLFVVDTQLQSLFFWFFIFIIDLFVKVLSVFNFIFQSQFVVYYFFQDLILLNFIFFLWLFVKVLLVFN